MVHPIPKIPDLIPNMVNDYLQEAKSCLENRTFKSVVLLCAAAIEVYLTEQLKLVENVLNANKRISKMTFEELIDWARIADFLTTEIWKKAHKVRKRRNKLIHPDRYAKLVKKEPAMRQLASRIKFWSSNYGPADAPRIDEVKSTIAFKHKLPKFAKDTFLDAYQVVYLLCWDKSFPGSREKLPYSLRKKYNLP